MDLLHHLLGAEGAPIAWWQMTLRAAVIFVYATALYRIAALRAFGASAPLDMAMTVIVGSSLSRALTANAPLIPVLAATAGLVALHMAVAHMARQSPLLSWMAKGRSVQVIADGEIDRHAMRRAGLGPRDLEAQLRQKGLTDPSTVRAAHVERNGDFSVIRRTD